MVAIERRAYHGDAALADDVATLRAYLDALRAHMARRADETRVVVEQSVFAEARRHAGRFTASIRAAVNIDLRALLAETDVVDLLALRVAENVRLIRSLASDVVNRVERIALGSILEGRGNRETERLLREAQEFDHKRAKLVARDQASKLNGDLNEYRQTQAGITRYQWKTTRDGRQRDTHNHNHDKIFAWAKPPSTGHPGREINCRCRARGLIETDED